MPYIRKKERAVIDPLLEPVLRHIRADGVPSGTIAYILTKVILAFQDGPPKSYRSYAQILGVLDTVGKEFYRRVVAPYEDSKITDPENGDVF